jgi:hypothetical protein
MVYFNSRDIAAISLCAALWGALNVTISPVFWTMTHLPFACDLIGFTCLVVVVWWTRKLGTATTVGLIATVINFILRPAAIHFVAFTVASILFDITIRLVGYKTSFGKSKSSGISLVTLSILSGALAGSIIGKFFMAPGIIAKVYGTVFVFAGLHALGGSIGGILGFILVKTIESRGVIAAQK